MKVFYQVIVAILLQFSVLATLEIGTARYLLVAIDNESEAFSSEEQFGIETCKKEGEILPFDDCCHDPRCVPSEARGVHACCPGFECRNPKPGTYLRWQCFKKMEKDTKYGGAQVTQEKMPNIQNKALQRSISPLSHYSYHKSVYDFDAKRKAEQLEAKGSNKNFGAGKAFDEAIERDDKYNLQNFSPNFPRGSAKKKNKVPKFLQRKRCYQPNVKC